MKISKTIENLSEIQKKLIYMCNVRPTIKLRALFSDATIRYREPEQPKAGEQVTLRIRTGRYNADRVILVADNN